MPNCILFHCPSSHFRDTGHFETSELTSKRTIQGQRYPLYILLVSSSPTVHSISLYDHPYSSYGPLCDKCTEVPYNNIEHKIIVIANVNYCSSGIVIRHVYATSNIVTLVVCLSIILLYSFLSTSPHIQCHLLKQRIYTIVSSLIQFSIIIIFTNFH